MEIRIFQRGFNYSQDGPGNRLVYHLQGCNLHCPWCANPEGMCCGGSAYPVERLIDEADRSRPMFFDGGGVTLTGGEPTVQFEAVRELLAGMRAKGINTAIETNGTAVRLPELFPDLNHCIIDCKHYDSERLKRWSGEGNEVTLSNIRAALRFRIPLLLRVPLIGTFNASAVDAVGFAELFRSLADEGRIVVELLPYHEYGRAKWEKLGLPYTMGDDAFISAETIVMFQKVLREEPIELIHT